MINLVNGGVAGSILDPKKKGGVDEIVSLSGLKWVKIYNFCNFYALKVCLSNTIYYFCS